MSDASARIRKLREEKELLQKDICNIFGIPNTSGVSTYENGRELPYDLLTAYAKYFNVSTDWILGLTTDRKPGGSDLNAGLDALATQISANGGTPITSDQLMQLLDALRLYYRAGAPAGNAPVDVLIVFIKALTAAVDAARAGDVGDLLISTNAVASAGLQAQSILASFLQQREK